MSRKHHEKQLARTRARRAEERARERGRRRIIIGMVVAVVVVAAGLTWWAVAGGDDDPDAAESPSPSATSPSPGATSEGATAGTTEPDETSTEASSPSPGATSEGATAGATEPDETSTEASASPGAAPCPAPTDAPTADTSLQWDAPPPADRSGTVTATIETTCGTIVAELDADAAPQTVANFAFLAEQDYYVGTPFHRVMADFVIQGGDPTGTGSGGPGYTIPDETDLAEQVVADNDGLYPRGTVAMAKTAEPDSGGSQFFIVQAEPGYAFPPDYTIFGEVVEGMDVVDDIANGPVTGPAGDQAVDPAVVTDITVRP